MATEVSATISADIRPLISMLPTVTWRKHCTSALRVTTKCRALRRPGIFPTKLIVTVPVQCKVAAQFSLDQGRVANDTGAANITFRGEMDIAACANRSAEAGGDFVISEIDVALHAGTDCRCRGVADLVFSLAFETFDN